MAAGVGAAAGGSETAVRTRVYRAYVAALLATEIALVVVVAKSVPRVLVDAGGETLSVPAIAGALGLGFLASRWIGARVEGRRNRALLGLLATLVALQIIGRADLSESASVWDMSWIIDLGSPGADVWRTDVAAGGALDEFFAALTLIAAWFRGVYLGGADLDDRSFAPYAIGGFITLVIVMIASNSSNLDAEVRAGAVVWAGAGVLAVALRHAADPASLRDGTGVQAGVSLLATLGALLAGIAVVLLIVTGIIAAVAGSGVVEPVLDGLGWALEMLIRGLSYLLWPLFWIVERLGEAIGPPPEDPINRLSPGVAQPLDPEQGEPREADPTAGIIAVRILGGIGAVLVFAILAYWLFRRFFARAVDPDVERESMWDDADLFGDLKAGLSGLRDRFRRAAPPPAPDARIAALYYEMLDHAAGRGVARAPARTPAQFAGALERAYGSALPVEISAAFAEFRYAGREPSGARIIRLENGWRDLAAD